MSAPAKPKRPSARAAPISLAVRLERARREAREIAARDAAWTAKSAAIRAGLARTAEQRTAHRRELARIAYAAREAKPPRAARQRPQRAALAKASAAQVARVHAAKLRRGSDERCDRVCSTPACGQRYLAIGASPICPRCSMRALLSARKGAR